MLSYYTIGLNKTVIEKMAIMCKCACTFCFHLTSGLVKFDSEFFKWYCLKKRNLVFHRFFQLQVYDFKLYIMFYKNITSRY